MNAITTHNCAKLKLSILYLPISLVLVILLLLYKRNAINVHSYIQIQKDSFFYLNAKLSQFPVIEYNLSEVGNTLVNFSFLSIFVVYAPKIWESLLSASIFALIFSCILKKIFAVPRPAAVFNNNSFVIIGKTLHGCNSLPSGHSITVFATLTILLIAFMPKKLNYKILWCSLVLIVGSMLVLTRVAIGAHYPLDVVAGSIVGYICALLGIFINEKYKIWAWVNNKKYYPIFILTFLIFCVLLVIKILNENLIIFDLSLVCLIISIYKITTVYVQK
ncbi:phosphatase PAP2 family protein [Flavobacterium sp. MC2016-06]|uniref:phosphatase PAP2 family protein n=1 Tax=Flavobacterium sp. MC2016-06 TaxID=2676308 RepID=UPI0012BB004A|nr:phosphatase PAP2 family protein [Flavobacterium sp. MC2016-06]MBU3857559.1 phosphatase PAP2 family protein [Flavobacterium sp. MC2016-06]